MKALVTGVAGQLGHDVMNELARRGYEGIGSDIKEIYSGIQDGTAVVSMPYVQMDITDEDSVRKVLADAAPDVVVHCAAWTAVDLAEDEDKKEIVYAVNATGTKNIADICKELDCKISRPAQGLPAGAGLSHADTLTLMKALEGRTAL